MIMFWLTEQQSKGVSCSVLSEHITFHKLTIMQLQITTAGQQPTPGTDLTSAMTAEVGDLLLNLPKQCHWLWKHDRWGGHSHENKAGGKQTLWVLLPQTQGHLNSSTTCLPRNPSQKAAQPPQWYSKYKESTCNTGHVGLILGVGKIPPEEGMATYSSSLAWRIPWTEEPGSLTAHGSQRVTHTLNLESCGENGYMYM